LSVLLFILAAFLFVLAALGVDLGSEGPQDLAFWGLALFALAHVVDVFVARVR
jgi:hypothetical protein